MGNRSVLLVTEANERVASGHLLECAELARLLRAEGVHVDVAVNDDACDAFKLRLGGPYLEYHQNAEADVVFFSDLLRGKKYSVIVTNLREVHDEWISRLRDICDAAIICIDEWGHRFLSCDVIINPMIDPFFWEYGASPAKLYAGQDYLILPEKITVYHERQNSIPEKIGRACVSMGGVDKFGSTVKIARWLLEKHPDVQLDVILGGGFRYQEELESVIQGRDNVRFMQNISDIYDYFEAADIAFCAGGNTLHELACIGTPAVIVPTMPHERSNGNRFGIMGFGITLGMAEELSDGELAAAWEKLSDRKNRQDMMLSGKRICSGNGGKLVVEIIKGWIMD